MVFVKDIMTTKIVSVNADDTISTAISKMSDRNFHHLPVVDSDGKYVGMVEYNLLYKRESVPVTTKVKTLMIRTPTISSDASISDAARQMLDSGIRALPVMKGEKLAGIVTAADIVKAASELEDVSSQKSSDIMSGDPITVTENDILSEALKKMREIDETSIPVINGSGKLVGMVNINDVSKALWKEKGRMRQGHYYRNEADVQVKDAMDPPLYVTPDSSVKTCIERMVESGHSVCVIADESLNPQGIISQNDILSEIARGSKEESVLVNLSGARFEDPEVYNNIYSIIEKSAKSIAKLKRMRPLLINVHIEEYNQQGKEIKYSVRGKMVTESKTFFSRSWEWNLYGAVKNLMDQLEKMVRKEKDLR
ncbi:MAG: CBS domain-containing protein [Thermoplasmatales archaeon]